MLLQSSQHELQDAKMQYRIATCSPSSQFACLHLAAHEHHRVHSVGVGGTLRLRWGKELWGEEAA